MRLTDRHIADLVHSGERGEAELIELIKGRHDLRCVAALGEASGPEGDEVLRHLVAAPGNDDERCAALVALAKRSGARGSDCFTEALTDRRVAVKEYAAACLCAYGDDRAWDPVLAMLEKVTTKPQASPLFEELLSSQSTALTLIGYLARHAQTTERATKAIAAIRGGWDRLQEFEQDWVREYWPAAAPDAADDIPAILNDHDALRVARWSRDPLFVPLYSTVADE